MSGKYKKFLLFLDKFTTHPPLIITRNECENGIFPVIAQAELQPLDLGVIYNFQLHLQHAISVSYTHLDVYKRQVYRRNAARADNVTRLSNTAAGPHRRLQASLVLVSNKAPSASLVKHFSSSRGFWTFFNMHS